MDYTFTPDFNKNILDDLFKNASPQSSKATDADEIIAIVDRSGSMGSIAADAEGGLNAFIKEQQKIGNANFTLVEFDHEVNAVYKQVDIKQAAPYVLLPRGTTALFDAIGLTLANAESITTTGKKIVVIVTDGDNNASVEYTLDIINKRIESLREAGWEFLFLAANQDAMSVGTSLGIDAASTLQYAAKGDATRAAYNAAASYTVMLRSGLSVGDAQSALASTIKSVEGLSRSDLTGGDAE